MAISPIFFAFLALFFCLSPFSSASHSSTFSIIDENAKHHLGIPEIPHSDAHQRPDEEVAALYESWLVHHGKAYNAIGEKERRFEIFKDNLRFIDEHNRESRTYKVGLTRFADLTNEEYRARFLGGRFSRKPRLSAAKSGRYAAALGDDLPDDVDWRKKGAVATVKDQGQCGGFSFLFFSLFLTFFFFC